MIHLNISDPAMQRAIGILLTVYVSAIFVGFGLAMHFAKRGAR